MRTRSKRARAAKQAQAQLDTVKGRIIPAVESAASGARDRGVLVAERVGPAYGAAKDKVGPAYEAAREKVGPAVHTAVETAREKAAPVVANARDRAVDDLLPRLAAGVAAASAAATAARDNAVESAHDAADAAVANLPKNKKKAKRRPVASLPVPHRRPRGDRRGSAAAKARKQEDP